MQKLSISLLFCLWFLPVFSQEQLTMVEVDTSEIYKVVDEQPRFSGCEEIKKMEKRLDCSFTKMLKFMYSNVKYPAEARQQNIEGTEAV
jgi:hypothetical protein